MFEPQKRSRGGATTILVRTDKVTKGRLSVMAKGNSLTVSELVRQMLSHCLDDMEKKVKGSV